MSKLNAADAWTAFAQWKAARRDEEDEPDLTPELPRRAPDRLTGLVKWFDPDKKYGFLNPDNDGAAVFVHLSALESAGINPADFTTGARVEFEIDESERGTCAGMLQLLPDDDERQFVGTIDKWFADRGYGFVQRDDGEVAFVHRRDTPFEPTVGERVAFDLISQADSGRGRAIRLRRA